MELAKQQLQSLQLVHRPPQSFIDRNFPKQSTFLEEKAPLAAAFCTRRAGKSVGAARFMYECSERHPGSSVLYLGLTHASAERIMWKDCVLPLDKQYKQDSKTNITKLMLTRQNGSVLYFAGADSNAKELEKLLGQKYSGIFIDEAQSWKQDVGKLVYDTLGPAVADYEGLIRLGGTPSNRTGTFFHNVTIGKEAGWSVHSWTAFDNPYMREKWARVITELKSKHPGIENTAGFRQNYMGEWVIEDSARVFRFNRARNFGSIPAPHPKDREHYVIGVDLGYSPDPTAFVICSYRDYDRRLYIHKAFKEKELIISQVADRIKALRSQYPDARIVIDAANKQAVEEMRQRYGLAIESAEKHGKEAFIALMNSDFETQQIIVDPRAEELAKEYETLVWDESKPGQGRKEDPACDNHCTDAALYAWRWSHNYAWANLPQETPYYSEGKVDEFWEREAEKAEREARGESDDV